MSVNYNPAISTDGLVLYLDAGNRRSYPGSGTTWADLSGNKNNSTLIGGSTFNNSNGGGIVFNNTNGYASIPYEPSLNIGGLNLTISCWLNATALTNALHGAGIFVRDSGSNDGLYEILLLTNGTNGNYALFRMNGVGTYHPQLILLQLNTNYNIVCVYDNGVMKQYINGMPEGTGLVRNINITTSLSRSFRIANRFSSTALFGGTIYNTLVYNRALSQQEVAQNFSATKGRFGL
jgi:hypothetical protein